MIDKETSSAVQDLLAGLRKNAEQKLYEPRFTIKTTGIGYRRMTNWGNQGLMPHAFEEGKWRRFSYLELTWFGMVEQLRQFELPIDIIRKLKESLWEEVSSWELFQQPGVREVINKLATLEKLEPDFQDLPDQTIQAMKEDKHSWLFFILMDALLLRNHWMILVNLEGKFVPLQMGSTEEFSRFFDLKDFIANSFVAVSLAEVIRKSADTPEVKAMFDELGLTIREKEAIVSREPKEAIRSLAAKEPEPAEPLTPIFPGNTAWFISDTGNENQLVTVELITQKES